MFLEDFFAVFVCCDCDKLVSNWLKGLDFFGDNSDGIWRKRFSRILKGCVIGQGGKNVGKMDNQMLSLDCFGRKIR